MLRFADVLHGSVEVPTWILPFIKAPEFMRLRGVRLSNVDSFQFKDFNGPTRWEHCIAVAALAHRCAILRGLSAPDTAALTLAGLYHDVGTPPFAHTAEYVVPGLDHEVESQRLLAGTRSEYGDPCIPVFASQLPQFRNICASAAKRAGVTVDPDEVARLVLGEGEHGFLIRGSLDLDNLDNVVRACLFLGLEVDAGVPGRLVGWLAEQESTPTELQEVGHSDVASWLTYRERLYQSFYHAIDEELAREAFLQYLFRRAMREGIPRESLVWNTDARVLEDFAAIGKNVQGEVDGVSLRELVNRYYLMDMPEKIVDIGVGEDDILRAIASPNAVGWLEETIGADKVCVVVVKKRYRERRDFVSLFPEPPGRLLVFRFGRRLETKGIRLANGLTPSGSTSGRSLEKLLEDSIRRELAAIANAKPWLEWTPLRKSKTVDSLKAVGDWSFRLSRNENLHPYPATFVHAIPANLIRALGLSGETVLDPFGGTGQCAVEAIKQGGIAYSVDSNSIATMIAQARLSFLSTSTRRWLKRLDSDEVLGYPPCRPKAWDELKRWFHHDTLEQLASIFGFVSRRRGTRLLRFLKVCFSAILPGCSGRRGEQYSYFADNTPVGRKGELPARQDALNLFLARVRFNVALLERFYAAPERNGRNPEEELQRARVIHADALRLDLSELGISPGGLAGIVTSPPYLCMVDYTLGLRLSYAWFSELSMQEDFERELGARRRRNRGKDALSAYEEGMKGVAEFGSMVLRPGGVFAAVLGAPSAKAFQGDRILERVDSLFQASGFEQVWSDWRPVYWHRNRGYSRLKNERISVYVRR